MAFDSAIFFISRFCLSASILILGLDARSFEKEILKIANHICSKSTESIVIGKQAFYNQLEMPIEDAYKYTSKIMAKNMKSYDAKEGISAFIEKRSPVWKD